MFHQEVIEYLCGFLCQLQVLQYEGAGCFFVHAATPVAGGACVVDLGFVSIAMFSRQLRLSESHLTLLIWNFSAIFGFHNSTSLTYGKNFPCQIQLFLSI
jgi:hypothetical protein